MRRNLGYKYVFSYCYVFTHISVAGMSVIYRWEGYYGQGHRPTAQHVHCSGSTSSGVWCCQHPAGWSGVEVRLPLHVWIPLHLHEHKSFWIMFFKRLARLCVTVFNREHRVDDQGRQIRSINEISEGINVSLWAISLRGVAFWIVWIHSLSLFFICRSSWHQYCTRGEHWPGGRSDVQHPLLHRHVYFCSLWDVCISFPVSQECCSFSILSHRTLTFSQNFHTSVHGHVRLD